MPRPNSSSMSGVAAGDRAAVGGAPGSGPAIATGVKPIGVDGGGAKPSVPQYRLRQPHASTDVMPARNAVDRLAVGKCLSHQGSLLVLAPAPLRLTQNNLHTASARDQSKRPVDRLGAAKILTYKPHHARRPSAQGYFDCNGWIGDDSMRRQAGFFDVDDRLKRLNDLGDQLEAFEAAVEFEAFRPELNAALTYSDGTQGGRPPFDPVMMF